MRKHIATLIACLSILLATASVLVHVAKAQTIGGPGGGSGGGSGMQALPPLFGRSQYFWRLSGPTLSSAFDLFSGSNISPSSFGAGVKSGVNLTGGRGARPGLNFGLSNVVGQTNGDLTAGAVTRFDWLPSMACSVRAGQTTAIGTWCDLDENAGTCNIGAGSTQFTAGASFACTTNFAGLFQDSRSTSPTSWWCCSGDGANGSCTDMGVTIAAGNDYAMTVDMSTAGQVTCTLTGVGGTKNTVLKTTNLPTTTTSLKVNVGTVNYTGAVIATVPIFSGMTIETFDM